jgi:hypothetical protein
MTVKVSDIMSRLDADVSAKQKTPAPDASGGFVPSIKTLISYVVDTPPSERVAALFERSEGKNDKGEVIPASELVVFFANVAALKRAVDKDRKLTAKLSCRFCRYTPRHVSRENLAFASREWPNLHK